MPAKKKKPAAPESTNWQNELQEFSLDNDLTAFGLFMTLDT